MTLPNIVRLSPTFAQIRVEPLTTIITFNVLPLNYVSKLVLFTELATALILFTSAILVLSISLGSSFSKSLINKLSIFYLVDST